MFEVVIVDCFTIGDDSYPSERSDSYGKSTETGYGSEESYTRDNGYGGDRYQDSGESYRSDGYGEQSYGESNDDGYASTKSDYAPKDDYKPKDDYTHEETYVKESYGSENKNGYYP